MPDSDDDTGPNRTPGHYASPAKKDLFDPDVKSPHRYLSKAKEVKDSNFNTQAKDQSPRLKALEDAADTIQANTFDHYEGGAAEPGFTSIAF